MVYLDASALVKLVVPEAESAGLARFLAARPERGSSALARVEVPRAVWPHGAAARARAARLVRRLDLLALDDALLDEAAGLAGYLRSLDAIHVAAAGRLGPDLEALVTYDGRMRSAARALGLPVSAPA